MASASRFSEQGGRLIRGELQDGIAVFGLTNNIAFQDLSELLYSAPY